MDSARGPASPPSKKTLENYAISYLGAYQNTVQTEKPDRLPALARNQFYDIDVCIMPNNCVAMLFEKSDKMNIAIGQRPWNYVETKVLSSVAHMVAIYSHEGLTVADAIARGKRDAVRDIKSIEDSDITKAASDLEKIVEDLGRIERENKGAVALGEDELAKLRPIREAIVKAGPEVDMLAILDALKNAPTTPTPLGTATKDRQMIQKMAQDMGDLSDIIKRVEDQDKKLEEIEKSLKKVLSEYNRTIEERISKGLAVILQASDKKIDKGLAVVKNSGGVPTVLSKDLEGRLDRFDKAIGSIHLQLQDVASRKPISLQLPPDLELRLDGLEKAATAVDLMVKELFTRSDPATKGDKAGIVDELVQISSELRDNVARLNARVMKVEEFLLQMQSKGAFPKQRVLRQKL